MRVASVLLVVAMVSVINPGIAADSESVPTYSVQKGHAGIAGQRVSQPASNCDLPFLERESGESVAAFKKRLKERKAAIASCERYVTAGIPASKR